jgi:hypothetical protein
MKKLAEAYAPKGVVWLGMDSTSFLPAGRDAEARTLYGLSYRILNDRAGKVGHVYGAKTTPHMFVIDAKGVLAYAGAIDSDSDGEGGTGVVNYVGQAIEDLLAGKAVGTPETKPYGCSVKYAK